MTQRVTEISGMLILGAIATAIAALTGTIFTLIMAFPFLLLRILFFPSQILIGLATAAALVAPVTLGLFPLAYPFLRERPVLAPLIFPALGLAGGGAIMLAWNALGVLPNGPHFREIFSAIGMVSGLIAGAFFGRGLHA